MELTVHKGDGSSASKKLKVSDATFNANFNEPLVHQVVIAYQAGGRSGTRAQKNRAAVRGGGGKPWRQKGTGRARAGTIRSPIWRGGGQIFPASTKDFSQKVNRKMYRSAIRSIFSELLRQEKLIVIDEFNMAEPKTKQLVSKLVPFGGADCLIIGDTKDTSLELSARNLHKVDVREVSTVDPVCLIRHHKVLVTVDALKKIEEWLQ